MSAGFAGRHVVVFLDLFIDCFLDVQNKRYSWILYLIDYVVYGLHLWYEIEIFQEVCRKPISLHPGLGSSLYLYRIRAGWSIFFYVGCLACNTAWGYRAVAPAKVPTPKALTFYGGREGRIDINPCTTFGNCIIFFSPPFPKPFAICNWRQIVVFLLQQLHPLFLVLCALLCMLYLRTI